MFWKRAKEAIGRAEGGISICTKLTIWRARHGSSAECYYGQTLTLLMPLTASPMGRCGRSWKGLGCQMWTG